MATQFAPVGLDTIEQGQFLRDSEEAFAKIQGDFIRHVGQHKKNASAALNLKINLSYDAEKKSYAIITSVEAKMPKAPPSVTSAFVSEDMNGQPCLFSQAAGTSDGDPKQLRLTDDQGEPIDLATGTVKRGTRDEGREAN